MKEYKLRLATLEDMPVVQEMCYWFFQDSHYSSTDFYDQETVEQTILTYFQKPQEEAIIILLLYNEVPVGLITGLAVPSFFSKGYTALEHIWWVHPEHRSKHSLRLLKALLEWSEHIGCSKFVASGQTEDMDIKKIYKHFGLSEKEYVFSKEL